VPTSRTRAGRNRQAGSSRRGSADRRPSPGASSASCATAIARG
jgi:hypothetical protein